MDPQLQWLCSNCYKINNIYTNKFHSIKNNLCISCMTPKMNTHIIDRYIHNNEPSFILNYDSPIVTYYSEQNYTTQSLNRSSTSKINKKENKNENENNDELLCKICYTEKLAMLIKCGHLCCETCCYNITECPYCREQFDIENDNDVLKIYIA